MNGDRLPGRSPEEMSEGPGDGQPEVARLEDPALWSSCLDTPLTATVSALVE